MPRYRECNSHLFRCPCCSCDKRRDRSCTKTCIEQRLPKGIHVDTEQLCDAAREYCEWTHKPGEWIQGEEVMSMTDAEKVDLCKGMIEQFYECGGGSDLNGAIVLIDCVDRVLCFGDGTEDR